MRPGFFLAHGKIRKGCPLFSKSSGTASYSTCLLSDGHVPRYLVLGEKTKLGVLLLLRFCLHRVHRTGMGGAGKLNKLYGTLKVKKFS